MSKQGTAKGEPSGCHVSRVGDQFHCRNDFQRNDQRRMRQNSSLEIFLALPITSAEMLRSSFTACGKYLHLLKPASHLRNANGKDFNRRKTDSLLIVAKPCEIQRGNELSIDRHRQALLRATCSSAPRFVETLDADPQDNIGNRSTCAGKERFSRAKLQTMSVNVRILSERCELKSGPQVVESTSHMCRE